MSDATKLNALFSSMGDEIRGAWEELFFKETAFAEIAFKALERYKLHLSLDIDSLSDWIFANDQLPKQQNIDSVFGDLSFTVYECKGFYVELLFWMDGTTAIHQHAFSGAFSVICGSSIHSCYEFAEQKEINESLLFGDVNFKSIEQLNQGDVRKIHSGSQMAHSLFHLNRPSISIVVRTYKDSSVERQYSYLKPFIAFDPFVKNERLTCQDRLINTLYEIDKSLFTRRFKSVLSNLDLYSYIMLIVKNVRLLVNTGQLQVVIADCYSRYPEVAPMLKSTVDAIARNKAILIWRQKIKQPELRFFLAVLLNAPDKKTAYQLIESSYKNIDVESQVCDWLRLLVNSGEIEDNNLSAESFPFIRCILKGMTLEETLDDLCEIYTKEEIYQNRAVFIDLYHHFINDSIISDILR